MGIVDWLRSWTTPPKQTSGTESEAGGFNLREFVGTSLRDILGGISDIQQELGPADGTKAVINPRYVGEDFGPRNEIEISFDLAVTAARQRQAKKEGTFSAEVKVLSAQAGAKLSREHSSQQSRSTVSRITFSVRVVPTFMPVRRQGD